MTTTPAIHKVVTLDIVFPLIYAEPAIDPTIDPTID
jgi:hypothetical protein